MGRGVQALIVGGRLLHKAGHQAALVRSPRGIPFLGSPHKGIYPELVEGARDSRESAIRIARRRAITGLSGWRVPGSVSSFNSTSGDQGTSVVTPEGGQENRG